MTFMGVTYMKLGLKINKSRCAVNESVSAQTTYSSPAASAAILLKHPVLLQCID
jgi:hypothetical protein